jgi:mannose-6-phosphate isomerase-like protein (cupin superfamily)
VEKKYVMFFICALSLATAFAQSAGVDAYSPEQLERLARPLHAQADAGNGTATRILANYPGHYTMIVYRDKDGEVEVHQRFADVIFVMSGKATLITGGTTQDEKVVKPGEIRGTSIAGGSQSKLEEGDLVHIPANTPHQLLILPGSSITYITIKVETPAS